MLIGACFLPCGLGNMSALIAWHLFPAFQNLCLFVVSVGAPLAGRLSDRVVVYYRKKRGGEWYPEDRLRATILGGVLLIPLSIFGSGLLTGYVSGRVGLALNMACLFMNGVGVSRPA